MATGSGGISSLPAPRSMLQQQLVRLLLVALVLLAIVGAHPGSAASVGATDGAVSLAEDEDSSGAVGASDEMVADESFEQDVSQAPDSKEATEGAQRADGEAAGWQDSEDSTEPSTTPGFSAVATTPKIVPVVKQLSRYEQGLEDYDEAADRAEREQQQQQQELEQQEQDTEQQSYSNMVKPMLTLFNVISTVLSSARSMRSMVSGMASTDGDNKNVNITLGGDSTSHGSISSSADNETAAVEGRYIKGDPLKGYYDVVISEYSYKFWAVFQVVTAAVVIYSTFTAIYYSKVAPLTSDYDYVDYLNGDRSFAGGRSTSGQRSSSGVRSRSTGSGIWDNLSSSSWFGPAAQAFTLVMDAIERQPK
ncbi:uncharacterized protein LOC131207808 [Anopheles bellator]|uniref:uncharacterized protein LOC131207808 n=1 Tax=Anopheles bellator TaxID=139047 RepID=UPI002648C638|nr:uncharacterized protein LOC131207808 [Anopheles bellator]